MNLQQQKSNFVNDEINPCIKESELSMKCLEENYYEQEKCLHYFKNYQVCKKFWGKVAETRKAKGIKPYMPGSVEREKITEELDSTYKFVYRAD